MDKKTQFDFLILFVIAIVLSISGMGSNASAAWWDKFGAPQYGGTINVRISSLEASFDVANLFGEQCNYFYESLWNIDWKMDRDIWSYKTNFLPEKYAAGLLAESWEMPDAQTIIVHLRKGIHWQNKPPVNGREFTAHDVVSHYKREKVWKNPIYMAVGRLGEWEPVTAIDNYTVQFRFKKPGATWFLYASDMVSMNMFEAPEWADQGDPTDWQGAVGTGPWMLKDYKSGTSMTFIKNPDYWGYDERHPKNRLPYADELKILCIPDSATAIAALRTGKLDMLGPATGLGEPTLSWQQAETLKKTIKGIELGPLPSTGGALDLRCDTTPFNDIRVRKALQMALDRKTIAQTYYGGIVDGTPCGIVSPSLKGYAFSYEEWPRKLKDEYGYNPERAKHLLAEAGSEGVFKANKIGGFNTNVVASSSSDLQLLQVIKAYFKEIGVDMEIREMEYSVCQSFINAGKHDQMVYGSCSYDAIPTIINHRWSGNTTSNYTYNNDAGYDEIAAKFLAATNPDDLPRLQKDADKYAIEKHWSVHLFPTATFMAWQPYLKGYCGEPRLNFVCGGYILARLWVDKDMKASMGR